MDRNLEERLDEFCGSNKMYRWIVDDVVDSAIDYEGTDEEKVVARLEEIMHSGCQSGTVLSLVWYNQTTAFFDDFYDEIYDYIEQMEANGFDVIEAIKRGNQADVVNIIMCDQWSKNNIAWLVYEQVCYDLLNEL